MGVDLFDELDGLPDRFGGFPRTAQHQVDHHSDVVGTADPDSVFEMSRSVGLAISPEHPRVGGIAGEVYADAPCPLHQPGKVIIERDHSHVGVPSESVAEAAGNEFLADTPCMFIRDVELGIAQMQHIDTLSKEVLGFVGDLGGGSCAQGAAFCEMFGAVDAGAVAAAFCFKAYLAAFAEVRGIVDGVTAGWQGQCGVAGWRIGACLAVLAKGKTGNSAHVATGDKSSIEFDKCLFTVRADAEIGACVFEELDGEYRIAYAAEDNRSVGESADGLDNACEIMREPFGAGPEAIVHVAKGDAHEDRIVCGEMIGQEAVGVFCKTEVEDMGIDVSILHGGGNVVKANGPNGRLHSVGVH